jgi:hypothetical protein
MEDRMAVSKWDPEMTTAIAKGFQAVLSQALPACSTNSKLFLLILFRKTATVDCNNLTYLLTPWSRVLLEKLTVNFAASQEIPRIYGTRKFLTVPTRAFTGA